MKKVILASMVVLSLVAVAYAQQTERPYGQAGRTGKAAFDERWATMIAKDGLAEVELAKLATEKASNDQVKQFARRMVDDHGKANDELKQIASKKNITLPTELDPQHKQLRDRLMKLSGEAFDRAYMMPMVQDHHKAVDSFKRESSMGKDPELKAFAEKTLPTLEEHLKLAQDTSRAVGAGGSKGTTGSKGANRTKGTAGRR